CAAPSAKGDDKFITTDYLQQCPNLWSGILRNWKDKGITSAELSVLPRSVVINLSSPFADGAAHEPIQRPAFSA
ncbi:conjugal transfer protein TraU, partial [Salmonella enterica subsp. enterica serovar Kentucky]|nr:conjugal transfer protein TraU [Salmonella enterica subsp. enterica serovar Kentucky]